MDRNEIINNLRSYDPNFDERKVNKAIDFAINYHGNQRRESGDPYYHHPLEVADIVVKMRLDTASVITAILHDTIEDTDLTLEQIEREFGAEVARLVDGVTKLTKIEFISDSVRQAENFRKLLVAMSEDIRVLLVKLADRLHNIRTIDFIASEEKRRRIALETMEIYAPLAERIGVQQIKGELQDTCFKILNPEIRASIINRLEAITEDTPGAISEVIRQLKYTLNEGGVKADVAGRRKTAYSIWQKMKQKNIELEQLSDIIAFRVIVSDVGECYKALGILHTNYKMVPESFQDFISTPKNNGYQSLHTVLIGPLQKKIEVQIRTFEMHEIAELGVAAHWRYKQHYPDAADGKQYRWVRELLSILEHAGDPEEFLQNTKLAMYYDQVFCFTPKGMLIALPKGATPIDFAYAVHSDLGNHCVSAKVNGRVASLRTPLKNGDQIEIVTSKNQQPSPMWEKFVVTGKAHSEIKKCLRSQQKEQYTRIGQVIIEKALKKAKVQNPTQALNDVYSFFGKKSLEELYYSIGDGTVNSAEVVKRAMPPKSKIKSTLALFKFRSIRKEEQSENDDNIPIKGLIPGMAVQFAKCCYPLPGDRIVGVVHVGTGITVHTIYCDMIENLNSGTSQLLNLSWDTDESSVPMICKLRLLIINQIGALAILTAQIANEGGNITNFKITNRNADFFEVLVDIEVKSADHAERIINALSSKSEVQHVERFKL